MARPPVTGCSGDGAEGAFMATVATMTARRTSKTRNAAAWLALKRPAIVVGGAVVGAVVATARFGDSAIHGLSTANQNMPPRPPPAMVAGADDTPRANWAKAMPGKEERDMPAPRRTPPTRLLSRAERDGEGGRRRMPMEDHDRGTGTVCPFSFPLYGVVP